MLDLGDDPRTRLAFEHEGRYSAMVVAGFGFREDEKGPSHAAVRDELLRAAEDVLVAIPLGARFHGRGVGAASGLGQRVRGHLLSRSQRRAQSLLLLLRSGDEDGVRAQGLDSEDQRRARASFGDLFDAHADRDAGARDATVFLRKRNAEDAVLGEKRLDVLRVLGLRVDLRRAWCDPVLHQFANRVPDRDLLGSELEIHFEFDYPAFYPRSNSRAITTRCTWFEPS